MRRSRRYWRQLRARVSGIGGQLQVHVLERWPGDRELFQAFPARERLGRELVQERRHVIGLALDELAARGAVDDAIVRRADAELAWWPDREDPPLLDDRDAVGESLGLVEVVRRQQDRLSEVAQRGDRRPGGAPGLRVEAGGGLVEEDQLGVADERKGEVQPPQLSAGEPAAAHVRLWLQSGEREHLLDRARTSVEARPVTQRLAGRDVAVDAPRLQHEPDPAPQLDRPVGGIMAEHGHLAARSRAVALEALDRGRLARPVGAEQPEDLPAADADVDPAHRLVLAVALAQGAHLDRRGSLAHPRIIARPLCRWTAGERSYQCTPLVNVAIASCSKETGSSMVSSWPLEAAESGNTL